MQKSLPAEADGAVHITPAAKAAAAPPTAAINTLVVILGFLFSGRRRHSAAAGCASRIVGFQGESRRRHVAATSRITHLNGISPAVVLRCAWTGSLFGEVTPRKTAIAWFSIGAAQPNDSRRQTLRRLAHRHLPARARPPTQRHPRHQLPPMAHRCLTFNSNRSIN